MLTLYIATLVALFTTKASCKMDFVNPPPFGIRGDFSSNPTYATGSTINIIWTPGEEGKGASLLLYQLNDTNGDWFGDMEYLTQGAVGVTKYNWLVGTRKDLSVSNMLYLSIFQEGSTTSDSNSHYFYLEDRDTPPQSSSLISSSSPSSTSILTPTSEPPSQPTSNSVSGPTSSPNSSSPNSPPSNGLSTGAKLGVGIGVGVPAALALFFGAAFMLYRRRRNSSNPTGGDSYYSPTVHYKRGSVLAGDNVEAAARSPVEMGESQSRRPTTTTTPHHRTEAEIIRYELS